MLHALVAQSALHTESLRSSRHVRQLELVPGLRNAVLHLGQCAALPLCQVGEQTCLLDILLNPLFLYRHPKLAKALVLSVFLASTAWSYSIGLSINFQLSFDAAYDTGTEIYTSPFVRILPYILGAATAWLLLEWHPLMDLLLGVLKSFIDLLRLERYIWHFALFVFVACIYSTIKRDLGPLLSISLFVFGRLFFSLSVCWMIAGSAEGRGVWWSRLLEAKGFQHLSRLSYAIYLLNPLVIAFFYSLTSASTHADPFMLVSCGCLYSPQYDYL